MVEYHEDINVVSDTQTKPKMLGVNVFLPSSCLWTRLSSFRIDVISLKGNRQNGKNVQLCMDQILRVTHVKGLQKNLIGGFQDGNFVLSVDLSFNLLPDPSLVLEQNPENTLRGHNCSAELQN